MSLLVGYARVSDKSQNLFRQIKNLEKEGCEKIYQDKHTGSTIERPGYKKMKSFLREGDVLVVDAIDRISRNYDELKQEWRVFYQKGVGIKVLDMPLLDTTKYQDMDSMGKLITDIVLNLLGWVAENEREKTLERQRQGIAAAKKRGVYKGRPRKYHAGATGKDLSIYKNVVKELKARVPITHISRNWGVSRKTVYRIRDDIKSDPSQRHIYNDLGSNGSGSDS